MTKKGLTMTLLNLLPYGCVINTSSNPTTQIEQTLKARFPHWESQTDKQEQLLNTLRLAGILDLSGFDTGGVELLSLPCIKVHMFMAFARMVWHMERRDKASHYFSELSGKRGAILDGNSYAKAALADLLKCHEDTLSYTDKINRLMSSVSMYLSPTKNEEQDLWDAAYRKANIHCIDDEDNDLPNELHYWGGMGLLFSRMICELSLSNSINAIINPLLINTHEAKEHGFYFATALSDLSGFTVRTSKVHDILAEIMGYAGGYQQRKHYLLSDKQWSNAAERYDKNFLSRWQNLAKKFDNVAQQSPTELYATSLAINDMCEDVSKAAQKPQQSPFAHSTSVTFTEILGHLSDTLFTLTLFTLATEQSQDKWKTIDQLLSEAVHLLTRFICKSQPRLFTSGHRPDVNDKSIILNTTKPYSRWLGGRNESLAEHFSSDIDACELKNKLARDGWTLPSHAEDLLSTCIARHEFTTLDAEWLWFDATRPAPGNAPGQSIAFLYEGRMVIGRIVSMSPLTPASYNVKLLADGSDSKLIVVKWENAAS